MKKESNPSNHLIGSIKYVGENLCRDLIEINLDEELRIYYNELKNSYFSDILDQNRISSQLNEKIYRNSKIQASRAKTDSGFLKEIIDRLSKILIIPPNKTLKATNNRSFQEKNSSQAAMNNNPENSIKPGLITSIHIYIHEIALLVNDFIKLKIIYHDVIVEKNLDTNDPIDFYEILNYKEGKNLIRIEIFQKVLIFFIHNLKFIIGVRKCFYDSFP